MHNRLNHKCHEKGCDAKHLDHVGATHKDEPWDLITQEEVEERFGGLLVDELLYNKVFFTRPPLEEELTWHVIDNTWVKATYNGRKFVHVIDVTPYPWYEELR